MDPATQNSLVFSMATAIGFLVAGVILSVRRGRVHPLLLVSIAAFSFSWIEAPYDWAVYAQFPPDLPRMPDWWPINWTWGGGLPSSVPLGYVSYFGMPALVSVALSRRLIARYRWRAPQTLLTVGLIVGFCWALFFNGFVGAQLGVFYYGRVIPGLAIFEGTRHQYPLYDSLAMGVQMMVMTYLLGRTDASGRMVIEWWADRKAKTRMGSTMLTIVVLVVIGNVLYLSVFAPHYVTKVLHMQTAGPSEQLFEGIPNQPL